MNTLRAFIDRNKVSLKIDVNFELVDGLAVIDHNDIIIIICRKIITKIHSFKVHAIHLVLHAHRHRHTA